MEYPEHVWFLISRNLSGEASEQENYELKQLLQSQPHLIQQYELLKKLWKPEENSQQKIDPAKISHILQLSAVESVLKDNNGVDSTSRITRRKQIFRWAALFVAICALVLGLKWLLSSRLTKVQEVVAKKGSRTRTILPDGSTVWINAGSRIVYEPGFNGQQREVTLYGEGYFDVVKDPQRPFIVHAGKINIKVLGTVFNVKSYPDDETMETTLLKGLVQITTSNQNEAPIYLHPNQKIILPQSMAVAKSNTPLKPAEEQADGDENISSSITNLDTSLNENERSETAWIYDRLEFRGDTFVELAKKLERWYNITIHFEDAYVRTLTFNGSLENETVAQAFNALQTANSFDFKIKDNEIFISSSMSH